MTVIHLDNGCRGQSQWGPQRVVIFPCVDVVIDTSLKYSVLALLALWTIQIEAIWLFQNQAIGFLFIAPVLWIPLGSTLIYYNLRVFVLCIWPKASFFFCRRDPRAQTTVGRYCYWHIVFFMMRQTLAKWAFWIHVLIVGLWNSSPENI